MSKRTLKSMAGACLTAIAATSLVAEATVADAQNYNNQPNGYSQDQYGQQQYGGQPAYDQSYQPAPPRGQYAPPPPGYEQGGAYDDQSQQYDRDYANRYSQWAAQYCVDQRNTNPAAGAIIGGVLGAVIGSSVAGRGDRGAGAVIGGALGAGTGAAIGSSSSSGAGCPPGYVVRGGAPGFAWAGPSVVTWAPAWYHPWVFAGGRWVYHPYRNWYWQHRNYWHPGWHGRPWQNRHERW